MKYVLMQLLTYICKSKRTATECLITTGLNSSKLFAMITLFNCESLTLLLRLINNRDMKTHWGVEKRSGPD